MEHAALKIVNGAGDVLAQGEGVLLYDARVPAG
mgnify:CR=1 FL=1